VPVPIEGSRPEDGGGLLLTDEEEAAVRRTDPVAAKYVRPLVGAREMLNAGSRWCFWLVDAEPSELRKSPVLRERLAQVRATRLAAKANTTSQSRMMKLDALAASPGLFTAIRQPKSDWLCIPAHSSGNRPIVPMAMFGPDYIGHNSTLILADPPMWLVAILQSSMFTTWIRAVGGRLKSDLRIEADLVYNTFPFPELGADGEARLSKAIRQVLDVRAMHPTASLADLYDPISMPPALVKAHSDLDKVVDALFVPRKRFNSDADRLSVLFDRYALLTATEGSGGRER
jgi:hypothetical protein